MRIANTVNDSIVDGHGLRFTVFTQGCPHHCPGCHNPGTHDAAGGREATLEELVEQMKKNPLIEGITLSGGEPFVQAAACADLARAQCVDLYRLPLRAPAGCRGPGLDRPAVGDRRAGGRPLPPEGEVL